MPDDESREARTRALARVQRRAQVAFPESVTREGWTPRKIWSLATRGLGEYNSFPGPRVGQLDAELLDDELLDLLQGQIGEAVKLQGSHIVQDWSHEIQLVLRAVLFKVTVWDENVSYGARMQNLQYVDARAISPSSAPTTTQKILYGLITVLGRYAHEKWNDRIHNGQGHLQSSNKARMLEIVTRYSTNIHSILALFSFLDFLVRGRQRTLTDRVVGIYLASPHFQPSRSISLDYLNRQLVWQSLADFLSFVLPLLGIRQWRRWLSRVWRQIRRSIQNQGSKIDIDAGAQFPRGELAHLPEQTCAICYEDQEDEKVASVARSVTVGTIDGTDGTGMIGCDMTDITNPYEAVPCGCVYCYVCIYKRLQLEEGRGWKCLRCAKHVISSRPWTGDLLVRADETSLAEAIEETQHQKHQQAFHAHSASDEIAVWSGDGDNSAVNLSNG